MLQLEKKHSINPLNQTVNEEILLSINSGFRSG